MMGEAHFTRAWKFSPADEARGGDGVMRCAKRAALEQTAAGRQCAGDGMNLRRDDRFFERQTRKNRCQPFRQHRLSRSRRTNHQDVVSSCSGDFQCAFCLRLSANVAEVGSVDDRFAAIGRLRRRDQRFGSQVAQQRGQVRRADDAHAAHGGGFIRVRRGNDQLADAFVARERR